MVSLEDSMIYRAISEIRYSFEYDEYNIFNFIKGFLDGNDIDETFF